VSTTIHQAGRGTERASPRRMESPGKTEWGQSQPAGGMAQRLTPALGWLSLGLGLPGLVMPERFARFIGLRDEDDLQTMMRIVGLRELAAGVGLLSQRQPVGWVWLRVVGDLLDLAVLRRSLDSGRTTRRDRTKLAKAAVLGVTALDLLCAVQLSRSSTATAARTQKARGEQHRHAITIRRSPEEVYRFWRDFENLPRFMRHLESVRASGDRRSHWTAEGPGGKSVEWDAEIVEDRPNALIAWRSLPGADVTNSGQVRFRAAPGGHGTEVEVQLHYDPPAGKLGKTLAMLLGKEPGQEAEGDLRRLKQVLETGEAIVSDATVEGTSMPQRPAQPPEHAPRQTMATR
jgi:uncharacterized membrane protein